MPLPPDGRRAEDARATRTAITAAARRLFAERGYFATKVEDIARAASVAPATVSAVSGGKQGLVTTLVDEWSDTPEVFAVLEGISRATTVEDVITQVSQAVAHGREEWGDVVRFVLTTAPHDRTVADRLAVAQQRYRTALRTCAERIVVVHGGGDAEAVDVLLWFHFGFRAFAALVQDCGWDGHRAQRWLTAQALVAVRTCLPDPAAS